MSSFLLILIFVAILVSKLVGKKISQAGEQDMPSVQDTEVPENNELSDISRQVLQQPEVPVEAEAEDIASVSRMTYTPPAPVKEEDMHQLTEEEIAFGQGDVPAAGKKTSDRKKIETRKMVVYSEIFRPKYSD